MSIEILALDSQKHRTHGWQRPGNFCFAGRDHWVPIIPQEVSLLLPCYLLAFAYFGEAKYQLGAVQGLNAGENLYVDASGRWLAQVKPDLYGMFPFVLSDVGTAEKPHPLLCFKQNSGLYREEPRQGEERFFDDDGKLQPLLQQIVNRLATIQTARRSMQSAVDAVAAANILEPLVLPESDGPPIKGLYRISEKALAALPASAIEALNAAHALPLVYAQLFSLAQLRVLVALGAARSRRQDKPLVSDSLDALFGNGGGGTISFAGLK